MTDRAGIEDVSLYVPRFGLDDGVTAAVGVPPGRRVAAPDEDAVTMLWEALTSMSATADTATPLLLATRLDALEPRAVAAHLAATGVVPAGGPVTALHPGAGASEVIEVASRAASGTLVGLVDERRLGNPMVPPPGESAIVVRMGEPRIAEVVGYSSRPALSFDRWPAGGERDQRFVEERLVPHEGAELVADLAKLAGLTPAELAGVVVTCGVPLSAKRVSPRWDVREVWPVSGSDAVHLDSGDTAAASLALALEALASAGEGSVVVLLDLGWGASGVVLRAGRGIRSLRDDQGTATRAYDVRGWMAAQSTSVPALPWTSASELSREMRDLLGPVGSACDNCGAVTFPRAGACEHCGSFDQSAVKLERTGTVVTHTVDSLYATPGEVQMIVVDLDGGGRFFGQGAAEIDDWLAVGDRCRLVLRRIHSSNGLPHYYWKVANHE